jgi:hypothetical protein
MLTPKTIKDLAPEISRLEANRDALDADIEMLGKQRAAGAVDPHSVVEAIKTRLTNLANEIPSLPPVLLMDVLAQLTHRLEADMDTKEVTFEFHFPTWMLVSDAKTAIAALCTRASSEFSTGPDTHRDPNVVFQLGDGTCRFIYPNHRSVDCQCSRRSRMAA